MEFIVHNDLNEFFEIAHLIRLALFPNLRGRIGGVWTKEESLNFYELYEGFQEIHEKYVETFIENFVSSSDDLFFFNEEGFGNGNAFSMLLASNRHWVTNLDEVTDEELRYKISGGTWTKDYTLESVVTQYEKWLEEGEDLFSHNHAIKQILFYQNPKKYFRMFIEIINNNLPAYRKARQAVEIEISSLLADFKVPLKDDYEQLLHPHDFGLVTQTNEFYPSLIFAMGIITIPGSPVFCGLYYVDEAERRKRKSKAKDVLAIMFKMLADQNKLEILAMLKDEKMYNLQIANALGISPAAANNHMTALLNNKFVSVERSGGKVIYSLEKQEIQETIANLEALLDLSRITR